MSHKKRILYVITQGAWGGAQRYVFDLATNLSGDFEVALAIGEADKPHDLQEKMLQFPNIKLLNLKHLRRSISPWHDILAVLELVSIYKNAEPDIVHLNSSKAGVIGSLAKVYYSIFFPHHSIKIVYTVHGWVFKEPLSKLIKEIYFWAEKITARWKKKIIVLSKEEEKIAMYDMGLKIEKLSLIPLGVDSIKFLDQATAKDFLEKKLECKFADTKIVGTIANLFHTKGLDVLVNAVNKIKEKVSAQGGSVLGGKGKVKFVIIGDGPEKECLVNLIKIYNLEAEILLAGSISDASKYLSAFDLFVLPSRKEGLPYTLLEAGQAHLPVIATEVGGVPSLIKDKVNGLLIKSEDPDALAGALEYALDHAEEMKVMAGKSLEGHELSEMLQVTEDLYKSI